MTAEDKTTLSAAQVDAVLPALEGWSRSEAVLARTFVFPNVSELTAFLTHWVRTMTEQQHHPDFPVIADLVGSNDFEFVAINDEFTVRVLDEDMVVLYGRINFTILDHEHGGTLRTLHNVQTDMFRRNPQMPRGWEFVYEQIGYRTPLLGDQKSK
jgi:pterin-4a-carbinolamine dehydratase